MALDGPGPKAWEVRLLGVQRDALGLGRPDKVLSEGASGRFLSCKTRVEISLGTWPHGQAPKQRQLFLREPVPLLQRDGPPSKIPSWAARMSEQCPRVLRGAHGRNRTGQSGRAKPIWAPLALTPETPLDPWSYLSPWGRGTALTEGFIRLHESLGRNPCRNTAFIPRASSLSRRKKKRQKGPGPPTAKRVQLDLRINATGASF